MRVTLFDRSICCDIARDRYGSTISTIDGDFMTDELGGPYDLALLSNIVHGCTPDELDSILMRLRKVVVPGGVVAIKDMFLNEAMDRPESAALFGMTMLLYTEGGRSYTHPEMHEALGRAGFDQLDCIEVPDQHFTLLIAR
jgi:C-methyltransferase